MKTMLNPRVWLGWYYDTTKQLAKTMKVLSTVWFPWLFLRDDQFAEEMLNNNPARTYGYVLKECEFKVKRS